MDGARIQALVSRGYGKAAKRLGKPCDLYRPADVLDPLALLTKITTLPAAFDATPAYGFTRPNSYGDALWHGLFDTAQTQVGDYLVGEDGTWFIAAQQPILPTICVACDRIVSIRRPAAPGAVGALGYSATVPDDEAVLMQGWPAGMVMRGIAKHGEANLPGEGPLGTMLIYLPAFPGIVLRNSDVVEDDLARRFVIGAAEITDLGWRLMARIAAA